MTGASGAVGSGAAVLTALLLLVACGADGGSTDARGEGRDEGTTTASTAPPPTTTVPPGGDDCPPDQERGERLDGALSVDVTEPLRSGQPATWRLTVVNEGGDVELVFPSGQDGDVVLLDGDGTEVHRWSDERFFTQALRCVALAAGSSLTLTLEEPALDVPPGTYTIEASVAATPAPESVRRQVTIEP